MKALIAIVITLTLIAAGSLAEAGGIAPNRTFSLRFVGFCDGMNVTVNYTTGEVLGISTGCGGGKPVKGWVADVAGGNYDGLAMVVGLDATDGFIYVISDTPLTWQLKNLRTTFVRTGTWAVGFPSAAAAEGGNQASYE